MDKKKFKELSLNQISQIHGGMDPVENTKETIETEYDVTEIRDGYNDDNNDGYKDVCETVFVNTTVTLKC